jgi:hypothetical protein
MEELEKDEQMLTEMEMLAAGFPSHPSTFLMTLHND